jgi:hypothetical protein
MGQVSPLLEPIKATNIASVLGLSNDARRSFIEGYSYRKEFSDGEIFRQICFSIKEKDRLCEERWKSRLTPTKERDMKKLLKHEKLSQALDDLLPIGGWNALHLGSVEKLLISCEEVSSCNADLT